MRFLKLLFHIHISLILQLKKEREDLYKPKILIDVNLEQSQQREREQEREREREVERQKAKDREKDRKEKYVLAQASRELASVNAEPIDSDSSDDGHHFSSGQNDDVRSPSETRDSNHNNSQVSISISSIIKFVNN